MSWKMYRREQYSTKKKYYTLKIGTLSLTVSHKTDDNCLKFNIPVEKLSCKIDVVC